MDYNKILKLAEYFKKKTAQTVEQEGLTEIIGKSKLSPWVYVPGDNEAPQLNYEAPIFINLINPILDKIGGNISLTVSVDGGTVKLTTDRAEAQIMPEFKKLQSDLNKVISLKGYTGPETLNIIKNYG